MTKKEEKKQNTLRYPPTPHPSLVIDVIIDLCMSFKKKKIPTLVSPYML